MSNEPARASSGSQVAHETTERSLRTVTTVVYALQAASLLIGITYLVAVVVNYVKRADAQGTMFESHFRWQIRTFWFSVLWGIVGLILMYAVVGVVVLAANLIWVIYRIAKGWLRLADGKAMYQEA